MFKTLSGLTNNAFWCGTAVPFRAVLR